ncbi:DUF262 domain-containing protein [Algoriphagus lutimaris]|uniref:DUF262 domain-containing protein n=1 Tax=Algoriphagus lutimaris TaxID=613197 RepID=UPI00196B862A|nr:DUF262 domain-containing protein [Algoriphagus lutimaris]MBN3520719.1 DUF262 domain-containing protein [Algoriphagus lutimaris]
MSKLSNKIEAHDRSISEVLDDKKYTVDYFQREYKWEERHIEQLVSDLTSSFLNEYKPEHKRKDIENYNSYYLGPFVVSVKDGQRSIIDGQQRLTSLTLLLIYLNNLQKELGINEKLESLIFSEKYGEMSFNIQVDERIACMESLFKSGEYEQKETDDESTLNMASRYTDIENAFPEEIKNSVLPFFIDWLKYNVVLVEIIAYSDENAYTIFETMNDRGLNLTPTEMLKGFILSKFEDSKKRQKANELWKLSMQDLHAFDKDEDQRFIQAWFRAQYAETIRPGKAGSKNEDFEKIGTRFHSWFRDNLDKVDIEQDDSEGFQLFIDRDFKFFFNAYKHILSAERKLNEKLQHVFYIKRWGIANSLSYPLLLSSLKTTDNSEIVMEKIDLVARYIETFVVRRSVNFRKFASSSIRYTMYTLAKEIRRTEVHELKAVLKRKLNEMEESWTGVQNFRLHGQNRVFVKFLLSRITSYVEQQSGFNSSFEKYYHNPGGKSFEVEHIWADKYFNHQDEFEQEYEFQEYRNRIGALVLLPRGTNQSFGAKPYSKKLSHYIKENLLVQSLCPLTYQNNPNFISMKNKLALPFKAHEEFKKADISDRQKLYQAICESIWGIEIYFYEN